MSNNQRKKSPVQKAIENKTIFRSEVSVIVPRKKDQQTYMIVQVPLMSGSKVGRIYLEEADSTRNNIKSLNYLIGLNVPFIVIGEEEDHLICSRKQAQNLIMDGMVPALKAGEIFDGIITQHTDNGCFIDVNGIIGFMNVSDYSSDHSHPRERYKEFDHISVKCKSLNHRIQLMPVTKYKRKTPVALTYEVGSSVVGRVVGINQFEFGYAVFVRIENPDNPDTFDVLCSMPSEMEVEKGVAVGIKITSVEPSGNEFEKPKIRGRILRTL